MPSKDQVERKRGKRGGKKNEMNVSIDPSLNPLNASQPVEQFEPESQSSSPQIHASRRMQMESALQETDSIPQNCDQENSKFKKTRRGRRGGQSTASSADAIPEEQEPEIQKTQRGKRKRGEVVFEHFSHESSIPELDAETRLYFENLEKVIDEKEFETDEGMLWV